MHKIPKPDVGVSNRRCKDKFLQNFQVFPGCASLFKREREYDGKGAGEVKSSSVHWRPP